MGIFLDPRFKLILSEDERQKSKRWIKDLHQQMLAVETRVHEIGQEVIHQLHFHLQVAHVILQL